MLVLLIFDTEFLNFFGRESEVHHLFLLLSYGLDPEMLSFEALPKHNAHLLVLVEQGCETAAAAIASGTAAGERLDGGEADVGELLNIAKQLSHARFDCLRIQLCAVEVGEVAHSWVV